MMNVHFTGGIPTGRNDASNRHRTGATRGNRQVQGPSHAENKAAARTKQLTHQSIPSQTQTPIAFEHIIPAILANFLNSLRRDR